MKKWHVLPGGAILILQHFKEVLLIIFLKFPNIRSRIFKNTSTPERNAMPICTGQLHPIFRSVGIPPGYEVTSGAEHGMECCSLFPDSHRTVDCRPQRCRQVGAERQAQAQQSCGRYGWRSRYAMVLVQRQARPSWNEWKPRQTVLLLPRDPARPTQSRCDMDETSVRCGFLCLSR